MCSPGLAPTFVNRGNAATERRLDDLVRLYRGWIIADLISGQFFMGEERLAIQSAYFSVCMLNLPEGSPRDGPPM